MPDYLLVLRFSKVQMIRNVPETCEGVVREEGTENLSGPFIGKSTLVEPDNTLKVHSSISCGHDVISKPHIPTD